jgi:hypothetical protein
MSKLLLSSGIVFFLFSSALTAQVPNQVQQRRREFVGDLLKTLIESQNAGPNRQQLKPGQRPPRPSSPVAGTRELQSMRQSLTQFSLQCDELIGDLQRGHNDSPQTRFLLADALQVRAQVNSLMNYANRVADHRLLIEPYQELDQNWRTLVHRVRQTAGIDGRCIKHIDQLSRFGDEIGTCLDIQPTFNRAELSRLAAAMNLSFQHLLQDLYYDNRNDSRIPRLLEQGKQLYAKIDQSSALIRRESHETIVAVYRENEKDWRKFVRKIRPLQTERIRRDIQEIEELGRAIHELLWLPNELDTDYILDVTRGIEADTTKLFGMITLDDLLLCESPGSVLNSAREFRRRCGAFSGSLENGLESWVWDYQVFSVQWRNLMNQCQPIQQARVVRRLNEIDNAMTSLTQILGQGPMVTQQDLIQLTSELDQISTSIQLTLARNVLQDRNYDRSYRNDFGRRADQLHESIHQCHESLVLGRNQANLNTEFRQIFDHWVAVKQLANRCNETHRVDFNRYRRDMEPLMVKLQVLYSN